MVFKFSKCLQKLSIKTNLFLPVKVNYSKLAYNVSALILSVPSNQKEWILTTINEELIAASALLVQSGALLVMVSVNIKLA